MHEFFAEVEAALNVLRTGGVLLYPTDTVWGLGCDAGNEKAVEKIYRIKQRSGEKNLILLVADERDILQYVAGPDPMLSDFLAEQQRPTTVIYENAVNLPDNLVADDGSIAIRIVADPFCRHLIKRLRRPVISTSANGSGEPAPRFFSEVAEEVKAAVDHVVRWRQDDRTPAQPSQIIRWNGTDGYEVIRS